MAKAQAMFDTHRKFVIGRIHAETQPYCGHFDDTVKDDIENEVWQTVAAKIADYRDFGHGPLAWLRAIVELTVKSHFRRTWAKKRGNAVTYELDEDNSRRVASPDDPPPVRPVRPAGAGPDDDREPSYERSETVGRRMARK
jgi:DNA-directed RNA polymerase specialized sigma24 family protein